MQSESKAPKLFFHSVPVLPVRDLKQTISFYKFLLGFSNEWFYKDAEAGISRGKLSMLFAKDEQLAAQVNTDEHGLSLLWFVSDADEIYLEFRAKGIIITSELKDQPWGVREFTFRDINGYFIRVAQSFEKENFDEEKS